MITITLSGFKTKEQAVEWLHQYEGGLEQHFEFEDESFAGTCDMPNFINEMFMFPNPNITNFNLKLK